MPGIDVYTPSLALHYLGIGIKRPDMVGPVSPTVFPRYKDYDPSLKISTDKNQGHMGMDTIDISNDRNKAEANPSFEDTFRFGEGLEDFLFLLTGSYDTPAPAVVGALTAKKYRFYLNSLAPVDLPRATILQGYNWKTAKAELYDDVVVNSMEFTLDRTDTPTFKADTVSNYPLFNQTEPTRVFPPVEYRLKASQGKVYLAEVGDSLATVKATEPLDYTKCTAEFKNNVEASDAGDYGKPKKDKKPFEGTVKITTAFTEALMNLEAEFNTGLETGTNVTEESVYKQVYIEFTGRKIETVSGADVRSMMGILIPKLDLTDVSTPKAGDDAKDITIEGDIMSNGISNPYEISLISPLADLHFSETAYPVITA
jgi:hypothetical protein